MSHRNNTPGVVQAEHVAPRVDAVAIPPDLLCAAEIALRQVHLRDAEVRQILHAVQPCPQALRRQGRRLLQGFQLQGHAAGHIVRRRLPPAHGADVDVLLLHHHPQDVAAQVALVRLVEAAHQLGVAGDHPLGPGVLHAVQIAAQRLNHRLGQQSPEHRQRPQAHAQFHQLHISSAPPPTRRWTPGRRNA